MGNNIYPRKSAGHQGLLYDAEIQGKKQLMWMSMNFGAIKALSSTAAARQSPRIFGAREDIGKAVALDGVRSGLAASEYCGVPA